MRRAAGSSTIPRMTRMAVAVAAAGSVLLVAGCGSSTTAGGHPSTSAATSNSSAAASSSTAPAMVSVRGAITIADTQGGWETGWVDTACDGAGGYADIDSGAQVVISDDAGRTLAITRLGDGVKKDGGCRFPIVPVAVPAGRGFYGVEVTHRGVVKFPEARLSDAELTIGG